MTSLLAQMSNLPARRRLGTGTGELRGAHFLKVSVGQRAAGEAPAREWIFPFEYMVRGLSCIKDLSDSL